MSNFAELGAHLAISSAFVVGSMEVITTVKPLTSVCMLVSFARNTQIPAALRAFSFPLSFIIS